jgi:hypothetical protein
MSRSARCSKIQPGAKRNLTYGKNDNTQTVKNRGEIMAVNPHKSPQNPATELGSRANKRLRDAGMLPGVIYGHKEAVIPSRSRRRKW